MQSATNIYPRPSGGMTGLFISTIFKDGYIHRVNTIPFECIFEEGSMIDDVWTPTGVQDVTGDIIVFSFAPDLSTLDSGSDGLVESVHTSSQPDLGIFSGEIPVSVFLQLEDGICYVSVKHIKPGRRPYLLDKAVCKVVGAVGSKSYV